MSTPIMKMNDSINYLIANVFVTPIVDFLVKQKGVTVTPEEILTVLNLPIAVPTVTLSQPVFFGSQPIKTTMDPALMMSVAGTAAVAKTTTKKTTDKEGPRCQYVISRGKRADAGEICGKKAQPGTDRCNQCKDKGKSKPKKDLPNVLSQVNPPSFPIPASIAPAQENMDLLALPNGHFRQARYDFYVVKVGGEFVVYGVMNNKSDVDPNNLRGLTEQEVQAARALGFQLKTGIDQPFTSQVKLSIPTVSVTPTVVLAPLPIAPITPAVPAISTAGFNILALMDMVNSKQQTTVSV